MQRGPELLADGARSSQTMGSTKGGLLDLSFAQTNAELSNRIHTFTKPPEGFQRSPCFKRSTRFQPNVAAQPDDLLAVPYFNGSRLQVQAYPGPGSYSPHKQSSTVLNGSHIEQYEGRLGNPSSTRPSFLARRVKVTTPMVGGPAALSLHGADRLLDECPAPGPGTYEQPDSVFAESIVRDGQFKCPTYGKGRKSAPYKSRSMRFAATRDETDVNARPTGLPEGRGARPLVKARGARLRWLDGLTASEGLRTEGVLRLGKATAGFARGTTALPGEGAWLASLYIKTPEAITPKSWSRQDKSDGVLLFVNGQQAASVKNEPGKMVPVTFRVEGASFDWEFRFSSSHKHFAHHPIVMDGTARCDTVAHCANARRARHQGRAFPAVTDVSEATISSAFLLGSAAESGKYARAAARELRVARSESTVDRGGPGAGTLPARVTPAATRGPSAHTPAFRGSGAGRDGEEGWGMAQRAHGAVRFAAKGPEAVTVGEEEGERDGCESGAGWGDGGGGSSSSMPKSSGADSTTKNAAAGGGGAYDPENTLAAMQAHARTVRAAQVADREHAEDRECVLELEKFVEPKGNTRYY